MTFQLVVHVSHFVRNNDNNMDTVLSYEQAVQPTLKGREADYLFNHQKYIRHGRSQMPVNARELSHFPRGDFE